MAILLKLCTLIIKMNWKVFQNIWMFCSKETLLKAFTFSENNFIIKGNWLLQNLLLPTNHNFLKEYSNVQIASFCHHSEICNDKFQVKIKSQDQNNKKRRHILEHKISGFPLSLPSTFIQGQKWTQLSLKQFRLDHLFKNLWIQSLYFFSGCKHHLQDQIFSKIPKSQSSRKHANTLTKIEKSKYIRQKS